MFCGECGTMNAEINQFCRNCGKRLTRHQPAIQQQSAPVAPDPLILKSSEPVIAPQPAVKKIRRDWVGILSLLLGILSWILLTLPCAILAIILGCASLYQVKKSTGKNAFVAIVGIILAMASVVTSFILG